MRRRRLAAAWAIAAGGAMLAAPPASAVQFIQGFTWYSDGSFAKSGPGSTVVTVYATNAVPNAQFDLNVAPVDAAAHGCSDAGTSLLFPNVRSSNNRGFIANTAGVVNRSAGDYEICFYERLAGGGYRTGTYPVFFTVT